MFGGRGKDDRAQNDNLMIAFNIIKHALSFIVNILDHFDLLTAESSKRLSSERSMARR